MCRAARATQPKRIGTENCPPDFVLAVTKQNKYIWCLKWVVPASCVILDTPNK
jgi:hypothetical protein